jgi:adenylylsulfate reductase subunit B
VEICPGSLLRLKDGAAKIRTPENCWGCASCLKACPAGAIRLYIGEDAGGRGGRLSVRREGTLLHWTVETPDGAGGARTQTVTVDSGEANHY